MLSSGKELDLVKAKPEYRTMTVEKQEKEAFAYSK